LTRAIAVQLHFFSEKDSTKEQKKVRDKQQDKKKGITP